MRGESRQGNGTRRWRQLWVQRVDPAKPRNRRGTHGFTLIELLVVIAIIAILASMLLPALASAKESGNRATCMNQLKQVSTAMTMYTVDNDEVYPSTRFGANGGTHCPANAGLEWHGTAIHATFAYINDASFYICPSRKNPAGFCNPCAAWARALLPRSSYQMSCATRHSAFTTVKQVKRPSDLALFGESRGGNYWRPASDQTGCDTGYLMVHRAGIQYSRFDTSVLWINSSRIHAPKAIVTAYLPWTNVENYQPGW